MGAIEQNIVMCASALGLRLRFASP